MKNLMLVFLFGIGINSAFANDEVLDSKMASAFTRFDEIRKSDLPNSEKTFAAFDYMADLYYHGGKPASLGGCFQSLKDENSSKSDPCLPVFSRESGGGTGGGGAF